MQKITSFFSIFLIFFAFYAETGSCQTPSKVIPFASEKFGFRLGYSDRFEEVEAPGPGVGLALRHRSETETHYPTVTVTIHPGPFRVKEPLAPQAEAIIKSYRTIGLNDASLERASSMQRQDGEALWVELTYHRDGELFRSAVVTFPGDKQHYILTYIDTQAGFSADSTQLPLLVDSFKKDESIIIPEPAPRPKNPERSRWLMFGSAIFSLFVFLGIIWYQKRRASP